MRHNPSIASQPVLRFPGSKRLCLDLLEPYLDWLAEDTESVLEPSIGAGPVTVWLAQKRSDLRILAADKDAFVAAFWQIVSSTAEDAQHLCAALDVSPALKRWIGRSRTAKPSAEEKPRLLRIYK